MTRPAWVVAPALVVVVGLGVLFAGLAYGGGAVAPSIGRDPGELVRWGLPAIKLVVNLSIAGLFGGLLLALFVFRPDEQAYARTMDLAAASAGTWTVASLGASVFTYLSLGATFSFDDTFGDNFAGFLTQIELGQAWLATVLIAAVATVLCFAVRNQTALAFVTVLVVGGQIPLSLQGHSGGNADHDLAVGALFLHVLGAAAWIGGLLALAIAVPVLRRERLLEVLPRYSFIALVCFAVVAYSGYVRAEIGVGSFDALTTPYGVLVLVKVAVLVVLGMFGAVQRRRIIVKASGSEHPVRWFALLATAELAFMGIASGAAAALARTATPVPDIDAADTTNPTAAELLTGRELPEPMSLANYLTNWAPDPVWITVAALGIALYLAGVVRLVRRGDRWPVLRTVSWIGGMLLLAWITSGGVAFYEPFLFSSHMLLHMIVGMMVPVLLVPGAPVTLALRTVRKRTDGSRGGREWILLVVHSWPSRILTNPIVAAVMFVGSLWVFYYSPLFRWAAEDHVGHTWMMLHFLLSGYVFALSLIGTDPVPKRAPYPIRLLVLLATMAAHAFFGLTIMTSEGLFLADWYGAMGWGTDALDDQQAAGGIAWSVGEIPTVTLAIAVAIMWSRNDDREAKRRDRAADRDDDAELAAYNAMLAKGAPRQP